ncbi:uncharacterized protein LOC119669941 [Teleopsis dalmanni]|uniref:uncharacterized protein LOC119669941 n=1 Tax=Teleopsis dalmanni TaxID=139649 RepID=UPI0018CDF80E|nr:uncharacterized protein LOC119669941 [Teleopsis dalmanni]
MNIKILCFMILFVSLTKADEDAEPLLDMDDMIEVFETYTSNCEPKPKKEHIKEMLLKKRNPQRETKCLRLCLMKQFEMINESGIEIVIENVVEFSHNHTQIKAKELKEIAEICAENVKNLTDNCEFAHLYDQCLVEELEKRGLKFPEIKE